jgi:hypothetical protein
MPISTVGVLINILALVPCNVRFVLISPDKLILNLFSWWFIITHCRQIYSSWFFLSESHWEIRKINNPVIRLSFFLSSFVTTFVCRENKLENAFLSLFIDESLSFVCSFVCLFVLLFVFRLFVHSFVCSFFLLSLFINESLPFVPSFGTWLHSVFRVVLKGACTWKSFRSREGIKPNENQFILNLDFTRFILTLFSTT